MDNPSCCSHEPCLTAGADARHFTHRCSPFTRLTSAVSVVVQVGATCAAGRADAAAGLDGACRLASSVSGNGLLTNTI